MYPERITIFKKLLFKKIQQLKQILGQKRNYELSITDYELGITDYELGIKQIFRRPLPNAGWPFRRVLHCESQ
jgi:hypothetical protein